MGLQYVKERCLISWCDGKLTSQWQDTTTKEGVPNKVVNILLMKKEKVSAAPYLSTGNTWFKLEAW